MSEAERRHRHPLLDPNRAPDHTIVEWMQAFPRRRLTPGRARLFSTATEIPRVLRLRHFYMNVPRPELLFLVSYTFVSHPGGTPQIRYGWPKLLGPQHPFALQKGTLPKDKWFDALAFGPKSEPIPVEADTFLAGGSLRLNLYYTGKAIRGPRPWTLTVGALGFTTMTPAEEA